LIFCQFDIYHGVRGLIAAQSGRAACFDSLFERYTMKALQDLFSTDYGVMSFIVIAAIVVVSIGAYVVLRKKMDETAANSSK